MQEGLWVTLSGLNLGSIPRLPKDRESHVVVAAPPRISLLGNACELLPLVRALIYLSVGGPLRRDRVPCCPQPQRGRRD